MPKRTKKKKATNVVATVRSNINPAIKAVITRRVTPDGHTYLDYEEKRDLPNGNESDRFYARNRKAKHEVVDLASDWIEQNPDAADGETQFCPSPSAIASAANGL